jgi:hypothetical protein
VQQQTKLRQYGNGKKAMARRQWREGNGATAMARRRQRKEDKAKDKKTNAKDYKQRQKNLPLNRAVQLIERLNILLIRWIHLVNLSLSLRT